MKTEQEIKVIMDRWNSDADHKATADFLNYHPSPTDDKPISAGDLTLRMTRPDQKSYLTILCLGVSFIDSITHIENASFHIYENCSGWVVESVKMPGAAGHWGATYIQADTIELIDNEVLQDDLTAIRCST